MPMPLLMMVSVGFVHGVTARITPYGARSISVSPSSPVYARGCRISGPGVFSHVAYVQRVATKAGAAPAAKCDAAAAGAEKRADYSAEYYFYE